MPAAPVPVTWDWRTFPFHSAAGDPDRAARWLAREGTGTVEGFQRDLRGLKVTLLSGLHDAHQNQLFFYNFFQRAAGTGALTWRTVLYERCRPGDLAGATSPSSAVRASRRSRRCSTPAGRGGSRRW